MFRAERYVLACVSTGAFQSVEQVSHRIGDVLAIAEGIGWPAPPPRSPRWPARLAQPSR